jgi:hypothetical protein
VKTQRPKDFKGDFDEWTDWEDGGPAWPFDQPMQRPVKRIERKPPKALRAAPPKRPVSPAIPG